jgi:hypothetical protein
VIVRGVGVTRPSGRVMEQRNRRRTAALARDGSPVGGPPVRSSPPPSEELHVRIRPRSLAVFAAAALLVSACETPNEQEAEFEDVADDPGADPEIDATDPEDPAVGPTDDREAEG